MADLLDTTNRESKWDPKFVLVLEREIEHQASRVISSHPHFRGRCHWLRFHCRNGCLRISGKLPTYYLKQLVQEALRDIAGIEKIDNEIHVLSPTGDWESEEDISSQKPVSIANLRPR